MVTLNPGAYPFKYWPAAGNVPVLKMHMRKNCGEITLTTILRSVCVCACGWGGFFGIFQSIWWDSRGLLLLQMQTSGRYSDAIRVFPSCSADLSHTCVSYAESDPKKDVWASQRKIIYSGPDSRVLSGFHRKGPVSRCCLKAFL